MGLNLVRDSIIMDRQSKMEDKIREAKEIIEKASGITVLTGAGISTESGVPTFRGEEGLWRKFRSEDLATPQAFRRDPKLRAGQTCRC